MNNKLFVGGIAWATDEESLKQFFSQAGTVVEAKILTDRETGRSRGFGFVTMATEEEAQKAIEMLNGKELDGRALNINIAQPPKEHSSNGGAGGGRFNNRRQGGGRRFEQRAPREESMGGDMSPSSDSDTSGGSDDMDTEE